MDDLNVIPFITLFSNELSRRRERKRYFIGSAQKRCPTQKLNLKNKKSEKRQSWTVSHPHQTQHSETAHPDSTRQSAWWFGTPPWTCRRPLRQTYPLGITIWFWCCQDDSRYGSILPRLECPTLNVLMEKILWSTSIMFLFWQNAFEASSSISESYSRQSEGSLMRTDVAGGGIESALLK